MSSLRNDIKKSVETDVNLWETILKDRGYTEEYARNFLSKLSPETMGLIRDNPDKVVRIIEELIKCSDEDNKDHIKFDYEISKKTDTEKTVEKKGDFIKNI